MNCSDIYPPAPKQIKIVATKRTTTSVEIHHAAQPVDGVREVVLLNEGGLTLTAWQSRRPFKNYLAYQSRGAAQSIGTAARLTVALDPGVHTESGNTASPATYIPGNGAQSPA